MSRAIVMFSTKSFIQICRISTNEEFRKKGVASLLTSRYQHVQSDGMRVGICNWVRSTIIWGASYYRVNQ